MKPTKEQSELKFPISRSAPPAEPTKPPMVLLTPCAKWTQGPAKFVRMPEVLTSDSRTIPDDTFTVKELFDRARAGIPFPLGLERPISYSEDPSHNDLDLGRISRLDLSELADLKQRVANTLSALTERQQALIQARQALEPKRDDPNDAKPPKTATEPSNAPSPT